MSENLREEIDNAYDVSGIIAGPTARRVCLALLDRIEALEKSARPICTQSYCEATDDVIILRKRAEQAELERDKWEAAKDVWEKDYLHCQQELNKAEARVKELEQELQDFVMDVGVLLRKGK